LMGVARDDACKLATREKVQHAICAILAKHFTRSPLQHNESPRDIT
jgi:uncharacterized protein (DUF2237 family)